jgi:hypothetical protein
MELVFTLGDDIKRYTSENEFIIQPRAIMGGKLQSRLLSNLFGYVHCFATRFYPCGIINFIKTPLKK